MIKDKSNIFSVDRGINQKSTETASMRVAHCCKSFPFFFQIEAFNNLYL